MQHGQLPPTLHFEKANPIIPFEDSPFKVNTELRPWVTQDVRRAAVSSFGIGGSNAHVVLEEAPRAGLRIIQNERPLQILTLSAKSESALRQLAGRYAEHLHKHPEFDVGDICFTANTGRVHFAHRLAASAETAEQLARQLQSVAAGEEARGLQHGQVHTGKAPGIAFLFTGQGAQFVGMGRQLYQTQATFRAALDECDQLLRPHLEQPLLSVLYSEGESANALLNRTAYAQPALFAIEYALMALWRSWGVVPEALLGHSVGEYVAACVAGVFSLEEGLWLIAERGRLMQSLPDGGAMAAVFASEERVREAIAGYPDEVAVAAVNAPDQVVISGGNERIKLLLEQFEGAGVQTRRLPVSHAFHSPLMQPILAEFEQQARQVVFRQPQLPIVSNLTGHVWIDGQKPDAAYWRRHLREPVRFATGLQSLAERGCEIFVELGPTPVLLSMAATVLSGANVHRLPSLRKGQDDWKQMTESFSALHLAGVEVDWKGFDRDYSRRRIALPTYPFERKSYWFQSTGADVYGSSQLRQEVSQQKPEVMSRVAPNNGSDLKKKETRMEEAPHNDRLLVARAEPTRKEGILLVLQPLMAHCLEMDLALVDIHTPFLEMGADSLVLLEAIQTIQTRFGVQLPIRLLFEEHTTLDALATFLEQSLPPVVQEDTALLTNPAAHHGNGASQTTVQSTAKACTPSSLRLP